MIRIICEQQIKNILVDDAITTRVTKSGALRVSVSVM